VNVIRASEDFKSGKIDLFFFAWARRKCRRSRPRSAAARPADGCASRLRSTHEEDPPEYYFSTVNPAPHIAGIDKPTKVQTIDFIIGSEPT